MKKLIAGLGVFAALLAGTVAAPASAAPSEPVPPILSAAVANQRNAAQAAKPVQAWQLGPKGHPSVDHGKPTRVDKRFKAERAGVAAPAPPTGVPVSRIYNDITDTLPATAEGVTADMTIADPYLNWASDFHSLMEISLEDADRNIVEIIWTVNPVTCPSEPAGSSPCLTAYSWINEDTNGDGIGDGTVGQGYGVGFVDNPSGDYNLGDQLPNPNDSSGLNFRIVETATDWWLGAGVVTSPGYWVGSFPKSNWTAKGASFTQATKYQVFTEVASTEPVNATWGTTTPCTDFGNGFAPTSPNGGTTAARILNIKELSNGGTTATNGTPVYGNIPSTTPTAATAIYPTTTPATNSFRVGGPGWKGNNTLPGSRDICG